MITIFNRKKLCKCKSIYERNEIKELLRKNDIEALYKTKGIPIYTRLPESIEDIVWHDIYVRKGDYIKVRDLITRSL